MPNLQLTKNLKDWFQYALAALLILGEFAIVGAVIFVWVSGPATLDSNVVNLVYGLSLGYHSAFMMVVGYFFGSSKGSSEKNEIFSEKRTDAIPPIK